MTRSLTLIIAALLSAAPAWSQSDAQNGTTTPAAPSEGQASPDPLDPGVEVSLGRTEVKQQLAQELGLPIADVPLSLHMPLELATKVCGQEVFDSEQDDNRSCTATHYAPELTEIARQNLTTDAPSQAPGIGTSEGSAGPQAGTYTRWSKLRDTGGAANGGGTQTD